MNIRMSHDEIALLTQEIKRATHYLEYGSGGSTKLAASVPTVKSIISVESDQTYLDEAILPDQTIQEAIQQSRLQLLAVDIGRTKKWGDPADTSKSHLWPNYTLRPYSSNSHTPDLILIDGRFRVACALIAGLEAPEATILIHDYPDRACYHILECYFTITEKTETLVKLQRSPDFDKDSARSRLLHYLYSPRDKAEFEDPNSLKSRIRRIRGKKPKRQRIKSRS